MSDAVSRQGAIEAVNFALMNSALLQSASGASANAKAAILALPSVQPDTIQAAALRETLLDLITEQSEGEWDDKTIAADIEVFLPRILALIDMTAVQSGHVNKTPKSEHLDGDVLKLSVQAAAREDGICLAAALVKERLGNSHLSNKILALIDTPKGGE